MNNEKRELRIGIFLVLALAIIFLSSINVTALGITPGRTTLNFEPGVEKTVVFRIVNTEHKAMNVSLKVEGEWASYVTLSQNFIELNESEEMKSLSYKIKFPLEGGVEGIKASIIATEISLPSVPYTSIGARVAVEHQLYVSTGITEKVITNVTNESKVEKINITKVSVKEYTKGKVARVEIEIFNPKEVLMKDVYAALFIYDSNGQLRSQFNSTIIDIEPNETKALEAFWDTQGFEVGNYSGKLFVYYNNETVENETVERDLKIKVEENYISIEFGKFEEKPKGQIEQEKKFLGLKKIDSIMILIIVAIIIIIAILLILYFKKLKT